MRTGNSNELANEPNAPMVFIAADSVPEYLPPTSQQTGQLALTVRSTPNVVKAKQAMNNPGERMKGAGSNVAAASPNPNMAGSLRDNFHLPALYIRSMAVPPIHIASAPQYKGILEYSPAPIVVMPKRDFRNGNNQLKQMKNVNWEAKY